MEPLRPGDGAPGVAVTASTPVWHGGPRVRKNTYDHARVPEIENFDTGAVAEDERRDAGGREDLPGHGLVEHGLLGRRFGGDRAVGSHFVCLRRSKI